MEDEKYLDLSKYLDAKPKRRATKFRILENFPQYWSGPGEFEQWAQNYLKSGKLVAGRGGDRGGGNIGLPSKPAVKVKNRQDSDEEQVTARGLRRLLKILGES